MDAPDASHVEVRRVFRAPPATIFAMWTRPDFIKRWNARSGLSVPVAEVDLRVGGPYRLHLRAPDGTIHRIAGVYQVVDAPRHLAYTWLDESDPARCESVVYVDFREHPDGTRVTLRHELLPSSQSARRHAIGWGACLDQLDQLLQDRGSHAIPTS